MIKHSREILYSFDYDLDQIEKLLPYINKSLTEYFWKRFEDDLLPDRSFYSYFSKHLETELKKSSDRFLFGLLKKYPNIKKQGINAKTSEAYTKVFNKILENTYTAISDAYLELDITRSAAEASLQKDLSWSKSEDGDVHIFIN